MEYKPHDYQQFAINYILEHPIAAVILGMGLGKTSITLTAIEQLIYDSCRAWFESAIRWKYADLVWTYLESGTISTDGGKTLETRTDFGDGGGSAYYYCWNNR